jgi:translation initiation factor 2B subunit (eIF-2B alpha/beta/delta family)
MDISLRREIEAIAADSTSGATALLSRGIAVLRRASSPGEREEAARLLREAQPAMAGFATAARVARAQADPGGALERLSARIERAPGAIAALGAPLLTLDRRPDPLRFVTMSRSLAVERTLVAARALRGITVSCGEGRPALEGRGLADALASQGIDVEIYTDAGLSAALPGAQAVVVGADAIGPELFVNKVGTAAICALATSAGIPVYVLAGREKILTAEDFSGLQLRTGPNHEPWPDAPGGIAVRNPYFETISLQHVTAVITDAGTIAAQDLSGTRRI